MSSSSDESSSDVRSEGVGEGWGEKDAFEKHHFFLKNFAVLYQRKDLHATQSKIIAQVVLFLSLCAQGVLSKRMIDGKRARRKSVN